MATKRKTTTAIVAGATAAVLLLGGTFAWTSISQQAKNEAIVDINPGGRLHDDFDGKNKDVYVENFSSGATGVDIFARVRLDQYFEVGQDAGINKEGGETRKVNKLLGDETDINNVESWVTYKPGDIIDAPVQANDNWQWTLGNDDSNLPYYMPTFNKNKDSLAADINGTYEGTTQGDIVHYDDFVKYGSADDAAADPNNIVNEITQDATYDWDEDTEDEENPTSITDRNLPIDSADVLKESETHTATQISTTANVISMADWLARPAEEQIGAFWVYDTDGWAYWAMPIAPETTTGLLLDSITMSRVPDDNYYYGINVVGQFATASDWTMLYEKTGAEEDAMTDGAKQLMELITATNSSTEDGGDDENPDDEGTLTLRADNADTVWTSHNIQIPVEFVTDDLDTEAEDYVAPDISEIIVYIEGDAGDGSDDTVLEKDTHYTYTYDNTTGKGTLTITDTTLEGYIHVTDKNGVVQGDVDITAVTALELTAEGDNNVEINPGDSVKVFSNDANADMSSVKVSYWVDFTDEGGLIFEDLVENQYEYDAATGELYIMDYALSETFKVTDATGTVSGYVSYYYESDATTLSIAYAASGEYAEINERGYIKPGESLMLSAATSDGQHINNEDCTWTASCDEDHPCTFENGLLQISDLGTGVDHPHLITVTCNYVNEEQGLDLTADFHIVISDEDLIFTTTAGGAEAAATTGEALTLSTTVSTATNGVVDLGDGDIEWYYSIVDENGNYIGDNNDAAVSGDQFMAFKQGTYYVTAGYTEYMLHAKTPSAITVTSGETMSPYYAQTESGYDDETDTITYTNITVGATDQEIAVIARIDEVSTGNFDKIESTTDGITLRYDEEYGDWYITVADTVNPGTYTLNYTINGYPEYGIADTTGTIDLVIDAAEATA